MQVKIIINCDNAAFDPDPQPTGRLTLRLSRLASRKYTFLGSCDRVRRKSKANEAKWHVMMKQRKKISESKFRQLVDPYDVLDEDETLQDFMADDPSAALYLSKWGSKPAAFIQTAGFEFIWVSS